MARTIQCTFFRHCLQYSTHLGLFMKPHIPILFSNQSATDQQDPIKRLSLAVRELDKLINRANQLASLSEQLPPKDQTEKPLLTPEADST